MEKFSNNKILIKKLINLNKTISCMESCTGGMLASEITNVEGASKAFSFGIVTYSNEEKIINIKYNYCIVNYYSCCYS